MPTYRPSVVAVLLTALVGAALLLPAGAAPALPAAPALSAAHPVADAKASRLAAPPTLGLRHHNPPYGRGFGAVEPRSIFLGGVPSGLAKKLVWRTWGHGPAFARGITYGYRPGGGYYAKPVRILFRASRVDSCGGHAAYTRLDARIAPRPGAKPAKRWRPWGAGFHNLCRSWDAYVGG